MRKILILSAVLAISTYSCKKDDKTDIDAASSNVICAGYVEGNVSSAALWTGSNLTRLPGGQANANSVFVYGNDVYVCGEDYVSFPTAACVWKNGSRTILTSDATAEAICVANGVDYVAGVLHDTLPYVAIGGNIIPLEMPSSTFYYSQYVEDITVTNGDYVVVGQVETRPAFWVNGSLGFLPPTGVAGMATGATKGSSGIFISGYRFNSAAGAYMAVYWLNGIEYTLTSGATSSYASGIAVSGTDVYVSGYMRDPSAPELRAVYWKNGVVNYLTSGQTEARAKAIAVKGSDVYVSGFESDASDYYIPKYWKNGVAVTLSSASGEDAEASDIAIK
ncbi:MAG: hypothetical protein ACKO1U_01040 [Bacteroidota bacterium]